MKNTRKTQKTKNPLVFDTRNIEDGVFNNHEIEVHASQLAFNITEIQFVSPVQGNVQLLRHSEDEIYVKAEVSAEIEMHCRRCLDAFTTGITGLFEIQFTPANNPEELLSDGLDDDERYYDGETFDISEDTRQALVIQIPVWPLCSDECSGFCTDCGVNLNDEQCVCVDTEGPETNIQRVKSPFAELPQLLASAKSGNELKRKNRKEITSKDGTSKT